MKKTMKQLLFSVIMSCVALFTYAQQRTVTGTVTDEQGHPLDGVSYIVKGTATGGVTTSDGIFSVQLNGNDAIIIFTYVGYQTREIAVDNQTTITVRMQMGGTTQMDEVVVTALGIRRENKKVGYAMTTIGGNDVNRVNVVNPVQALQGQVPGLSVNISDGGLFGNSRIQLRGVSTINSKNNQPIFVIDGVILENGISDASADWNSSSNDFGNILKNLNPEDYKSITVLRGAAATALYGSRGMNGAIVIETKNGAGSKGLGISIRHTLGIDHVWDTPALQYEFGEGYMPGYISYGKKDDKGNFYRFDMNQFNLNSDGKPTKIDHPAGLGWGPKFDGNKSIIDYDGTEVPYLPYKNNMLDAYRLGINNTTSIALSGANEKGNFYLSDAYTRRTGVFPKNAFDRNALQFTGSYNLSSWLKADAAISFTTSIAKNAYNDLQEPFGNGTWTNYYNTAKYKQRQYWQAPHGGVPNNNYGDENSYVPGAATWFWYNMNDWITREQVTRPIVKLTAKLSDWMSLLAEGNLNYYTTKYEGKVLGQGYANDGGSYQLKHSEDIARTGKINLSINRDITPDISADFILGGEVWKQDKSTTSSWTNGGLIVPGKFFIGNSKENVGSEGFISGTKQINSLYFVANFGYRNELFVSATGRNDWSSALIYTNGTGNNSYFYPSISASWIANETFNLPSWFSFAKFRASWAQVGNDTDPYMLNTGYGTARIELPGGGFAYTNSVNTTFVDPTIKPERKNSVELGTNLKFFRNRFGIDFSFYNDDITNQIGVVPVPYESGIREIRTNIGTLQNRGLELSLDATPIVSGGFKWNTVLNYWRNKSKVTKLSEQYGGYKTLDGDITYGNFRVGSVAYEGREYGTLMSDILPAKVEDPNSPNFGKQILTWTANGRGAFYLRSNQVKEIGKMLPDWESSWTNNFSYKNISLSIQLDGRFGGNIASYSSRYGTAYGFLESSLKWRDEAHGGITWTSKYADTKDQTFHDGVIPDGVFRQGQKVITPAGNEQDVSGLTYREAYEKGYVEPTHAGVHTYFNNSWGQGTINSDWFAEVKYIALRNIFLGYNLPKNWYANTGIRNLNLGLNVRNLLYLYNSLPNNLNPEAFRGTGSASFRERNFMPYTRNYTFTLAIDF